MPTHSSVLAWRIPGTGEPGGLPSMGSHRVGHDWSNLAAAAAAYLFVCFFLCKNETGKGQNQAKIFKVLNIGPREVKGIWSTMQDFAVSRHLQPCGSYYFIDVSTCSTPDPWERGDRTGSQLLCVHAEMEQCKASLCWLLFSQTRETTTI